MLVVTATNMVVKTNGDVWPTQTIASVTILVSLYTRNKITGVVKTTKTITWMITVTKMIMQFKMRANKTTTRTKMTTVSQASIT